MNASQKTKTKKLTREIVEADWEKNNERLIQATPELFAPLAKRFPGVSEHDMYLNVDEDYVPAGATEKDRCSKFQVTFDATVFDLDLSRIKNAEIPSIDGYIDLNYYPFPETPLEDLAREIAEDLEGIRLKGAGEAAPVAKVEFLEAAQGLKSANEAFAAGQIKSVPHADLREELLGKALVALAKECGVRLQSPLRIDTNGEVSLVALKEGAVDGKMGCAQFGERFAGMLTGLGFRTGTVPLTRVDPETGWGKLNHFAAEKLVLQQLAEMGQGAEVATAAPTGLRKALAQEAARPRFNLSRDPDKVAMAEWVGRNFDAQLRGLAAGTENPLERYMAVEATFDAVNARINAALDEVREEALHEILRRTHDLVSQEIVAVRIGAELEQDDDGAARYAPKISFGVLQDGEVDFIEAWEMDKTFEGFKNDDPRDALREVAFQMAEGLAHKPFETWVPGAKKD